MANTLVTNIFAFRSRFMYMHTIVEHMFYSNRLVAGKENILTGFRHLIKWWSPDKIISFEKNRIIFTQECCVSSQAQWFWRRKFLNFINVFSQLRNYLPFEKDLALHLKKLESTVPKHALCQVWFSWPISSWEEDIWIVYTQADRQTDGQTYDGKTGDQKSSLELSAQVS